MCKMMTEIQTIEGGQKRCPPQKDQHKKYNSSNKQKTKDTKETKRNEQTNK